MSLVWDYIINDISEVSLSQGQEIYNGSVSKGHQQICLSLRTSAFLPGKFQDSTLAWPHSKEEGVYGLSGYSLLYLLSSSLA